MIYPFGALAQLGAHNTGSVGVRGSNPLRSTKSKRHTFQGVPFAFDGAFRVENLCERISSSLCEARAFDP